MGLFKDAPTPPNPILTGAVQTATNVSTALANSYLNNVNQQTPYGSLTNNVTGNYVLTDPTSGAQYNIPRWTATQSLTPTGTASLGQSQEAQLNLSGLANQQSDFLQTLLGTPFDPNRGGNFNANQYLQNNPDVAQAAFTTRSSTFNPEAYLKAYPDVAAAANNPSMNPNGLSPQDFARLHYQQSGQQEGRMEGFPIDPYGFAAQHYAQNGYNEGRLGSNAQLSQMGDEQWDAIRNQIRSANEKDKAKRTV